MSLSNREIQLTRNAQLYAYMLDAQDKEVPYHIQECADYDDLSDESCLVDCLSELVSEIKSFDNTTFERIVNNKESDKAQQLAQWWEMYKIYIPLDN